MSYAGFILVGATLTLVARIIFARRGRDKIPLAHWSCSVSDAWSRYRQWREDENVSIYNAHQRHGPLIRLGPNEVSLNTIKEGLESVYAGNFDKTAFYDVFVNFEEDCMFSERTKRPHLERRKMLNSTYSKSSIISSMNFHEILRDKIFGAFHDHIRAAADRSSPLEILEISSAIAIDVISEWVFGLTQGTSLLVDSSARKKWIESRRQSRMPSFKSSTIAFLDLLQVPWLPDWLYGGEDEVLTEVTWRLSQAAQTLAPIAQGPVFHKLNVKLESLPNAAKKVASEAQDHLLAGSDTASTVVLYLLHSLSQRPELQQAIRASLPPLPNAGVTTEYLRALDAIPLLDAVINETLRLYPPVAGKAPRVVPPGGATIAGYRVAGGTTISASAYSLHRNAEMFPEPEKWDHERWLVPRDEDDEVGKNRREMDRWFWPWSSGPRVCLGKAFALLELKAVLAAVYERYDTSIVDDTGIEPTDGFTPWPTSGRLLLRVSAARS